MKTLTIPKLSLKLNNEVSITTLSKIKLPKITICVISTSIDNDENNLFLDILKNENINIITNKNEFSLEKIVKLLVTKSDSKGNLNTDVLLLNISPKYANPLFKYLKPNYIVIKDDVKNLLLPKDIHLILNADNPLHLLYTKNNPYTLYGLEINKNIFKNKFSKNEIKCPNCCQNLSYNYYYNENLGDHYCSNCDQKRIKPNIYITHIDDEKNIIVINDVYKINLKEFNISNIYNILLTYTLATILNVNENNITNIISTTPINEIIDKYNINKRIVYVNNTRSLNNTLLFINQNKELKTIIFDFDETKNLYEINFELLKNDEIDRIICTGNNNYDVASRIKYSNINEEKIVAIKDLDEAIKYINLRTEGNIYAVLEENIKEYFNNLMKGN